MRKPLRVIILGLILIAPAIVGAQPRVFNVFPRQNEINVPINSRIEVTFSENMRAASIDASSWIVYGSQSGRYSGAISYDEANRRAIFSASSFFKDGETISVHLTPDIEGEFGQALASGFQWSFTVNVEYGTGTFEERMEIPLADEDRDPFAIAAADFDNDHFVDLAVVNNASNSVAVFMNEFFNLGGSFTNTRSVSVGNGPVALATGDFDADGFVDLATANFHGNSVSVLLNDQTARFFTSQTLQTSEHPVYLEARDYNNDGYLDLAVVILGINAFQIFINRGNGDFATTPVSYPTGASPQSLASGDFDNDGDCDIVVSNSGDHTISIFKNNGSAQFTFFGETNVQDSPALLKTNDLVGRSDSLHFGDGHLDLVLVHANMNSITILDNRSQDGGFAVYQEMTVGNRPLGLLIADIDTADALTASAGLGKDHDLDLIVPNLFSGDVHVLKNRLNNSFSGNAADIYPGGSTPLAITGGDFDRDGDIDVAVTNLSTQTISILFNKGGDRGGIRFSDPSAVLDFGEVYVGEDSTRVFRILNPGEQDVRIDDISTSSAIFTVSESQAVIRPGEQFAFAITFSPADTGLYEERLTIRSDDFVSQPVRSIGLRGRGIRTQITVIPDTLDFGVVFPPQTRTLPLEIRNGGRGTLTIFDMQFSAPIYASTVSQFSVPPNSRQVIEITFAPTSPISYLDTLTIFSNDKDYPEYSVILLGSGTNEHAPEITSTDSVTAVEDVFFQYAATATDSDGSQIQFHFRNVPSWLSPASLVDNTVIEGTPREGDGDTSFVVIATDGFFSDTLSVFVRVLPVNDPPVITPIADQLAVELRPLSFLITASDPEDSVLTFSTRGLPPGAAFVDHGNRTASFDWTPAVGSSGVYTVTFVVREAVARDALSDTATVRIRVQESLPDLVASLQVNNTDIALHQTRLLGGVVRNVGASIDSIPFRLTFFHDGQFVKDTVLTSLGFGQEVPFSYLATFARLGTHEIILAADWRNDISEDNEQNNNAILRLQVSQARLVVRPNPFTPNQDGFNDQVRFDFSRYTLDQPHLKIFDFNGVLLANLTDPAGLEFQWDGRDGNGREQKPGIYLYLLSDHQKKVATGYVVLAR